MIYSMLKLRNFKVAITQLAMVLHLGNLTISNSYKDKSNLLILLIVKN